MSNSLFIPASFFLVRTPIWPIEQYKNLLGQEHWIEAIVNLYDTNELLREAVSIASPSLYQSLKKRPLKDPEQTALSLFNYALRMATRATPFGLFSFISIGSWSKEACASFESNKICKRARPDMEWIYNLVQKIYDDKSSLLSLSVRANPLAWVSGERVFLNYVRQGQNEGKKTNKTLSIAANQLVKSIFSLTHKSITINILCIKIQELIPSIVQKKLESVIDELLSRQFLLPGILPSLLNHFPFEKLLPHLPASIDIKKITQKIASYNKSLLGKGEIQLLHLQTEMEDLVTSKTCLQVDASCKEAIFQLPKEIGEEVGKALDLLWKVSICQPRVSKLDDYHARFVEKYGTQRVVPLLELLSDEKGLGSFLNVQPSAPKNENGKLWEKWLMKTWQECLRDKTKEISISEKLFEDLFPLLEEDENDRENALLSLDVFCKIVADSSKAINEGNFSLLLSQTTPQGCSAFGRFFDLISKENQLKIIEFIRSEEQLEPYTCFIELSYWPSSIRSANVAIHPCFRTHRLDIEKNEQEKKSFSLEDIYVGATHDKFYITLKDGKAEIEACIGNLLNLTHAPVPLQFMREVTLAKRQSVFSFSWGALEIQATFLPRVRFKKTILSSAQWKLDASPFIKETPKKIYEEFSAWANKWDLPQQFFLVNSDLQLRLDRHHPAHIHEITQRLKKGESLHFIENFEDTWVKSNAGSHSAEVVIPFTKNPIYAKKKTSFFPLSYFPADFKNRWKLPAGEWLYIKFYQESEGGNRFLLQHLVPFAEYLRNEAKISGWFFVRYADPETHLRFRLRLSTTKSYSEISTLLHEKSLHWMETGLIKNIVLTSYERELERYGGPELIEAAESVFCADSLACTFLLQASIAKSFVLDPIIFHSLSVISFLSDFDLDHEEILSLLETISVDQSELKGFREHKHQLIKLAQALKENSQPSSSPEIEIFREASKFRSQAIKSFCQQAKNLTASTLLTIYSSMLHMHCNRLGCNSINSEKRTLLFAKHTLLQIKYKHTKQAVS